MIAYQHTNRRGEVYFIQTKQRGGKTAYSASRKPTGKGVDRLPEGYEIYERPENAQVFVRKIRATRILPLERQLVETSIRKLAELEHFVVQMGSEEYLRVPHGRRTRCRADHNEGDRTDDAG